MIENKQSEEAVTKSVPLKRDLSNLNSETNLDDIQERNDLKRQKIPTESNFESQTTASSTSGSQNPFLAIQSSSIILEPKVPEVQVNVKTHEPTLHRSRSSSNISRSDDIHSSSSANNTASKSFSSSHHNSSSNSSSNNNKSDTTPLTKTPHDFNSEIKESFIQCRSFMSKLLFERLFSPQNDQQQYKERPQSYVLYRQLAAHTILSSHSILYKYMRFRKDSPPTKSELPAIVIAAIFLAGKVLCVLYCTILKYFIHSIQLSCAYLW